jgi:Ca2+-binding RTX toxin-like protein
MPGTSGTSGTDSITGNSPGKLVEAGAGNDTVNGGEGMDYLQATPARTA